MTRVPQTTSNSTSRGVKGVLLAGTLALSLGAILRIYATFTSTQYDWDFDHEIYFALQAAAGNLPWTVEFHDKLPFGTYMFLPAAILGDLTAWRTFSLILILAGALSIIFLVPDALNFRDSNPSINRRVAALTAALFMFLCVYLPWGFTTINPAATSLATIATLLLLTWRKRIPAKRVRRITFFLLATLTTSAAISIRPYFLAPLMVLIIWVALWPRRDHTGPASRVTELGLWLASIALTTLLINFAPYVVSGQLQAIYDGLRILSLDLNPTPTIESFVSTMVGQGLVLWFLLGALTFGTAALKAMRLNKSPDAALMLILIFLLAISIISTHWWPHYVALFAGFTCLLFASVTMQFLSLHRAKFRIRDKNSVQQVLVIAMILLISGISVFALLSSIRSLILTRMHVDSSNHFLDEFNAFQDYRRDTSSSDSTFLAPSNMLIHWLLREPRHGFPHAANIWHIHEGWWSTFPEVEAFPLPRNPEEYCLLLREQAPTMVLTARGSHEFICLSQPNSGFALATTKPLNRGEVAIFRRS
jgi:hypothetical protein